MKPYKTLVKSLLLMKSVGFHMVLQGFFIAGSFGSTGAQREHTEAPHKPPERVREPLELLLGHPQAAAVTLTNIKTIGT